jgi:MinD-like ATPase involved in chromosome partitioning or flagellar assembly
MGEIDFADGFEVSEPVLLGLTPVQLGVIVAGMALGYLTYRSPLPRPAGAGLGAALTGSVFTVARLRVEGRTFLSWLAAAVRYRSRPRSGLTVVEGGPVSGVERVVKPKRRPVTLLPMPVSRGPDPGSSRESIERCHRVVFFSLVGGSGRTTLAVEVAAALAARPTAHRPGGGSGRAAVGVIDLDLLSPRASLRLGVPLATNWQSLVDAGAVGQLAIRHPSRLRAVPGPAGIGDGRFAEDPHLPGRLEALIRKLELDCGTIIFDLPGSLGPVARWALDAADVIAVVLTPTAGGLQDAYRSTEVLRRLGHARKLRYVVNRGDNASLFDEAMADLGGTVVGCVPDDPGLTRAEVEHRLVALDGDGPTASSLRALATRLVAPLDPPVVPALQITPLLGAVRPRERQAG